MQALDLKKVIDAGKLALGFNPLIQHAFVDVSDVVVVALGVINDPKEHRMAQYELMGENISHDAIASIISQLVRKDVRCEVLSPEDFVVNMKAIGAIRTQFEEETVLRTLGYCNEWLEVRLFVNAFDFVR